MLQAIIEYKLHNAIKAKSASYLKTIIARSDFNVFKQALSDYLEKITNKQAEGSFEFKLKDFLQINIKKHDNFIGKPDKKLDKKIKTDLVICKGKNPLDNPVVLFEAKKSNSSEMITKDNLNKKAFQQLILYFMLERHNNNNDIKTLIACNPTEFFIFNARDFEDLFYKNTDFRNQFEDWHRGGTTDDRTPAFYDITSKYLDDKEKINAQIPVTYFNLNDYKQDLNQPDNKDSEKKLEHLYKIFTPEFLFNKPLKNDNNSLNKEFYNELLYIIGLHEIKENNKYVIQRLPEHKRNQASLIENTILKIQSKNKFSDKNIINHYGLNVTERAFNIALELCLVWVNRLLFLKLLEAQIVSIHKNNPDYKFLYLDKISDYDDLSDLFFEILAKKTPERHKHLQEKFKYIPYLNSSLFEISDMEDAFSISMLNNADMPVYKNTVLKNDNKPLYTQLKTLDYIFKFLDAYNFSSDNDDTIQDAPKTIINASVLGLIFEKINGYKDGSIFTPSYITMYMSRQVIEQAVIEKFKEKYKWNIETIDDLKNHLTDKSTDKIKEYNKDVINKIKICDPAVGSGHFLVSCLNELIYIKSYLGILADEDGKRIAECDISLENDEIIILNDITNEPYCYAIHNNTVSPKIQHIQKTLFHEKQTLIENCLFGVDINQNSVNICRLRLWIELLKNAYYTDSNFTELETLPNIDINIKCGNALLSRFGLTDSLSLAFKNKDLTVTQYRNMVKDYKNTKDKAKKRDLETGILDIKNHFRKEHISTIDREISVVERKIIALEAQTEMFAGTPSSDKFMDRHRELTIRAYKGDIEKLEKTKQAYETDLTFMNALEWRFEFPEVLDDDGTFIGFDIIIGNPPYIQLQRDGGELATLYETRGYDTFVRSGDIYILFYEKGYDLLSTTGILSFITSNKWLRAGYGEKLRTYLCHRTKPLMLIDLGANVFDNATVDSNILTLAKRQDKEMTDTINASSVHSDIKTIKDSDDLNKAVLNKTFSIPINSDQWIILDTIAITIKQKLQIIGKPLKDWNIEINRGILTGYNEAFIIDTQTKEKLCQADPKSIDILKPILRGKDIKKWKADYKGLWLINSHNGYKNITRIDVPKDYPAIYNYLLGHQEKVKSRGDKGKHWTNLRNCAYLHLIEQEKIIYPEITQQLNFTYDDGTYFILNTAYFITVKNPKYVLAILNAKITNWYYKQMATQLGDKGIRTLKMFMEQLPIVDIPEPEQSPFVDLTNRILFLTQADDYGVNADKQAQVASLQSQIDRLVYSLYGLTADEVKVIEGEG